MAEECPECGRSSSKFRKAARSFFEDWLRERHAEVAKDEAAEEKVRSSRAKAHAKLEAESVAWAEKWDGHTHSYPKKPVDGRFVCTGCGHGEPASALAEFKLQADEPFGGAVSFGGVVLTTHPIDEAPAESVGTGVPVAGSPDDAVRPIDKG